MKTIFSVILISAILTGCQFSKSVKKDLISGLTTTGNVLSCNDVYLMLNNEKTTLNSFRYGERIYIYYDDIQGFTRINGKVFPAMEIAIVNQTGDTVLYSEDLYSGRTEGMDFSPLKLSADLTLASPIKSKGKYTLNVIITDNKGPGTYSSKLKFSVIPDNQIIVIPSNGVTYDEIYLYSQVKDKVITDSKIAFNDNIYIMIEGLKGFREENGRVFPGLSLIATDSVDDEILNYDDLFKEYTETGIAVSDFTSRVSTHFKVTGDEFNNPFHCELVVWDKKSTARINVTSDMTLE
jgi:hypothetical protein